MDHFHLGENPSHVDQDQQETSRDAIANEVKAGHVEHDEAGLNHSNGGPHRDGTEEGEQVASGARIRFPFDAQSRECADNEAQEERISKGEEEGLLESRHVTALKTG